MTKITCVMYVWGSHSSSLLFFRKELFQISILSYFYFYNYFYFCWNIFISMIIKAHVHQWWKCWQYWHMSQSVVGSLRFVQLFFQTKISKFLLWPCNRIHETSPQPSSPDFVLNLNYVTIQYLRQNSIENRGFRF